MHGGGGVGGFIASRHEERYVREYPTFLVSIAPTAIEGEHGFGLSLFHQTSYGSREEGKDWTGNSTYLWTIAGAAYMALLGPLGFVELGRKIRAPAQEEPGVETYTALWGRPVAVASWLAALAATLTCAMFAAQRIAFAPVIAWVMGGLLIGAGVVGIRFLNTATRGRAKAIEVYSGGWTLTLYLTLGVVPLVVQA